METVTLSYIIPLYNGSKTIIKCLDSIYASGMPLECFEVIVVDDCSADDSVEVVEHYAVSHPNIRVIRHAENKRQGGAKNTGIRTAHGKYIAFADQDDVVISENLAKTLDIAKAQEADMISFRWMEVRNGIPRLCFVRSLGETEFSGVDFCEKVFDPADSLGPGSYLYKRAYLNDQDHFFAENVMMEDADWIAWHLVHARMIHREEMPVYQWIRNDQSITASTSWQFKADFVLFGLRKIEGAEQYGALSRKFAQTMHDDGVYNIETSLRTLWKADRYKPFFEKLGKDAFERMKKMSWSPKTSFMISHPAIARLSLSVVGPILKAVRSFTKK